MAVKHFLGGHYFIKLEHVTPPILLARIGVSKIVRNYLIDIIVSLRGGL